MEFANQISGGLSTAWSVAVAQALTARHARGSILRDGVPVCPVCGGKHVTTIVVQGKTYYPPCGCNCDCVMWERERTERESRAKADAVRKRTASLQSAGQAYAGVQLSDDDMLDPNNSQWALDYVERCKEHLAQGHGAVLCGPCGTGKTWLAAAMTAAIQTRFGSSVLFTSLPALIDSMHQAQDRGTDTVQVISTVDLLVIDDFGTEAQTSYRSEKTWQIIDSRYRAQKPTIYTTNLLPADLQHPRTTEQERIYQRILQSSYCRCLMVNRREQLHRQLNADYYDTEEDSL